MLWIFLNKLEREKVILAQKTHITQFGGEKITLVLGVNISIKEQFCAKSTDISKSGFWSKMLHLMDFSQKIYLKQYRSIKKLDDITPLAFITTR